MPHGEVRRRANPRRLSFGKLAICARTMQSPQRRTRSGIGNLLLRLLLLLLRGDKRSIIGHQGASGLSASGVPREPSS